MASQQKLPLPCPASSAWFSFPTCDFCPLRSLALGATGTSKPSIRCRSCRIRGVSLPGFSEGQMRPLRLGPVHSCNFSTREAETTWVSLNVSVTVPSQSSEPQMPSCLHSSAQGFQCVPPCPAVCVASGDRGPEFEVSLSYIARPSFRKEESRK